MQKVPPNFREVLECGSPLPLSWRLNRLGDHFLDGNGVDCMWSGEFFSRFQKRQMTAALQELAYAPAPPNFRQVLECGISPAELLPSP